MVQLGAPFSLDEIRDGFAQEYPAVYEFFAAISPEQFFAAPPEVWSPADNLAHLIKSCQPLLQGLKLPRLALRMRFGLAKAPSGSLAALRDRYVNVALYHNLHHVNDVQRLLGQPELEWFA